MRSRPNRRIWQGWATFVFWGIAGLTPAQETSMQRWTSTRLPLANMPAAVREKVRYVADHPTLYAQGSNETFLCNPAVYNWFLDHPDRAAAAWRLLGAKVVDIVDRGNGHLGWTDGSGSDIHWDTVSKSDDLRVWYADGQVKPGPLLAAIPLQAVVVLGHTSGENAHGRSVVRHQADLILHTDSRGALLVARLFGSTSSRLAEQYVSQLEMFFSALPWYIDQHPERAQELLSAVPTPPEMRKPRKRWSLIPSRRLIPSPTPPTEPPG